MNRFLISAYQPFVNFVLRFRGRVHRRVALLVLLTIFRFKRLGNEFMPPLNEGTLLYMPTAVPGMSITEATKISADSGSPAQKNSRSRDRIRQSRPGRNADRSRAALDV